MNKLIYYPTGCYGTFLQWLCNTPTISGPEDLPFHVDGNSHKYVLSDQYQMIFDQCEQNLVSVKDSLVVSYIWPLDHNGKMHNELCQVDFYNDFSQQNLKNVVDNNRQILILHPTETSKIWWWHNKCKKVFYTPDMFEKLRKNRYVHVHWLTITDPIQRARVEMSHYYLREWYNELLEGFRTNDANTLTPGQLRTVMAHSIHNETFDSLSHWQQLPGYFPVIKFVSLDQLRDHTKKTIQDIFEYFEVESNLPLDFVVNQWTALQTTCNRDAEHSKIVNCIVNGQHCDWSDLNFDLFDEVYLLYALRFQHNIILNADSIDCLPTNTHDLLLLR